MHCNKHVIKLSSELANMLLWPLKLNGFKLPNNQQGKEVKLSHFRHPASLWVRASKANYQWALTHFVELLNQYSERYGRLHFARVYYDFILENLAKVMHLIPSGKLTQFARCFGNLTEALNADIQDTVKAYRVYYILDKSDFARWPSFKQVPKWFGPGSLAYGFIDPSFKNGKYTKRK